MPARSRYRFVDASQPEAAGRCDRGGEVVRRSELMPQMAWAGNRLVPTGLMVCARHMDVPNGQDRVMPHGRDPVPVRNPRPNLEAPVPAVPSVLGVTFILGSSSLK